jgi:hypothetical protein
MIVAGSSLSDLWDTSPLAFRATGRTVNVKPCALRRPRSISTHEPQRRFRRNEPILWRPAATSHLGKPIPNPCTTHLVVARTTLLLPRAVQGPPPSCTGSTGGSTPISTDSFAAPTGGQHSSEVEPDTFSNAGTTVSAFQVGRYFDGGATDVGWATFNGTSWTCGLLPNLTVGGTPAGPYARATDASVAYDAAHHEWLISTLGLTNTNNGGVTGAAVLVSRSSDGITWSAPFVVSQATGTVDYDKNWIVCDNTAGSPHVGNCYSEFDNAGHGDELLMNTSSDGGQTWTTPVAPTGTPSGLGGQPLVQPNGTVIVPASNGNETAIIAFSSTNGGASWGNTVTVSTVSGHLDAGGIRSGPLPSAEIDSAGKVYVVWSDCRFEINCAGNDLVLATSTDGVNWSSITRIPIAAVNSGGDYFIPGLAVNPATIGSTTQLALAYYYYPVSACSASTCQLESGFVSSVNGGSTWSTPTVLSGSLSSLTGLGPMNLSWLPSTSQGPMVADYISTSFDNSGHARPVFAVTQANNGTTFHQAMYSATLTASGGAVATSESVARSGTNLPFVAADNAAKDRTTKRRD